MAIIQNLPCPKCQENNHDSSGNHAIVFEDGGVWCGRTEYHKDGLSYSKKPDGIDPALTAEITGKINYTPEQFNQLDLSSPWLRNVALSGMSNERRYLVANSEEKDAIELQWAQDDEHYGNLKTKNLISRGIRGDIAKLYQVKVGQDSKGKVARHYYPKFEEGKFKGAKCRTLPKDFIGGHLGRMFGKDDLFGMHTTKAVMDSGQSKHTLLIVGGECDAMAAQQMLYSAQDGTKYAGRYYHVWSPMKGECIQDIVANLEAIKQFKKVIWAFDNDTVGNELNEKAWRLLRDKSVVMRYPEGIKDANQCLLEGRDKEFVDAWWSADIPASSELCTADDLFDEALEEVEEGLSWSWETLTDMTLGIRLHNMYTIGAGSGVGKTEIAKETIQHLIDHHKENVGVIFMEEKASYTLRVLAGKWINKKLHLPPTPKGHPKYDIARDYTQEDVRRALEHVRGQNKLIIADCKGDTHIDNIMDKVQQLRAMGVKYIFIDNLTAITFDEANDVKGIDGAMKRLGTYMHEEPVAIFLISHLTRPHNTRESHEEGGHVQQRDFRGSGSIAFWSTFMIGVERNTQAEDRTERMTTTIRCVKDRLTGMSTGRTVTIIGNERTGRLVEPSAGSQSQSKGNTAEENEWEEF